MVLEDVISVIGWVISSKYRKNILSNLEGSYTTPSGVAYDFDIRLSHASKVLQELKQKGLVVCLNEEASKGRMYQLTDKGKEVLNSMKNM